MKLFQTHINYYLYLKKNESGVDKFYETTTTLTGYLASSTDKTALENSYKELDGFETTIINYHPVGKKRVWFFDKTFKK